jgi:hypothetical protein
MPTLTKEERARVSDTKHNIQAASASLSHVDRRRVPKIEAIEECLESADQTLREVLRTSAVPPESPTKG